MRVTKNNISVYAVIAGFYQLQAATTRDFVKPNLMFFI